MNDTGNTKNIGIINNIGNAKHSMKGQFMRSLEYSWLKNILLIIFST